MIPPAKRIIPAPASRGLFCDLPIPHPIIPRSKQPRPYKMLFIQESPDTAGNDDLVSVSELINTAEAIESAAERGRRMGKTAE